MDVATLAIFADASSSLASMACTIWSVLGISAWNGNHYNHSLAHSLTLTNGKHGELAWPLL